MYCVFEEIKILPSKLNYVIKGSNSQTSSIVSAIGNRIATMVLLVITDFTGDGIC